MGGRGVWGGDVCVVVVGGGEERGRVCCCWWPRFWNVPGRNSMGRHLEPAHNMVAWGLWSTSSAVLPEPSSGTNSQLAFYRSDILLTSNLRKRDWEVGKETEAPLRQGSPGPTSLAWASEWKGFGELQYLFHETISRCWSTFCPALG